MDVFKLLFLGLFLFYANAAPSAGRSCLATHSSVSISGNDLNGVAGKASDCCQQCQYNTRCRAYTWTSFNGGTCWLKNDTQPFISATQETVTGILSPLANETYGLIKNYAAPNFFEDFWLDDRTGHVFGFSRFVNDNKTAWDSGLFAIQNDKVYLGVDHTNVVPNNTWGRYVFRINSFQIYNAGLFVLSMDHIPTGQSSGKHDSPIWPAWWLAGDNHWNSEFDMFEGYMPDDRAFIALHNWDPELHGNCTIPENITQYYNGSGNASKRMSQFSPRGTSLEPFNQAGGGVYAMQWDHENFIREWTFVKPNVPADLLNGNPNPNPDTWGMPNAYFPFGKNCNPETINNMYLIFDIAFCGSSATDECKNIVRMQPEAFNETYFLINYMKVFCRPNEQCLTGIYGSG